ncbi:hypothetical protein PoB_001489400 [Plakobranchus ocellatus]|uniref:Uncharacterized protein n=1 Tax=Plakobranchus ocellatus TaxID=259542 RepID=A0AAV3Z2V8_9GAST|nr:hypothetical protein PoB_001489400 [Plakobranchus ocellatus]
MALQVALPPRPYRFEGEVPESCAALLRRWPKTVRGGLGGASSGKRRVGKGTRETVFFHPVAGDIMTPSRRGSEDNFSTSSSRSRLASRSSSYHRKEHGKSNSASGSKASLSSYQSPATSKTDVPKKDEVGRAALPENTIQAASNTTQARVSDTQMSSADLVGGETDKQV